MPKSHARQLCPGRLLLDATKTPKLFVIVGTSHTNICMLSVYDSRQMALLPPQKSLALFTTLPQSFELPLEQPLYADSSNT
jgi:hypothetical protein